MLAYACVYSFYNQDTEHMDVVEQQTENLELHTNALQILLGAPHPTTTPSPPLPPTPTPSIPSQQTVAKQPPSPATPLGGPPPPHSSQPYHYQRYFRYEGMGCLA